MDQNPVVSQYMTTLLFSIGTDQTINTAHHLMREKHIRHLPVLEGGQIRGVVSDRDLTLALSMNGVDGEKTKVSEIATEEAFLVKPDSPLSEVVQVMAEKKIGSVLVVDRHKLVGIFTTIDALTALKELLLIG